MTAFEVVVVFTCLFIVVVLLLSILAGSHRRVSKVGCDFNLKEINLDFRIWAGDNNNQYPMAVSVTNGGAMEPIQAGNLASCLRCASNEMSSTKMFVCPADPARTFATNFDDLSGSHVSYFLSADAREDRPKMVLDGDDNLESIGAPVKPGLFNLSSNTPIAWAAGRHSDIYRPHIWSIPKRIDYGYIGFADGSVDGFGPLQLQNMLLQMGNATNRIAIP